MKKQPNDYVLDKIKLILNKAEIPLITSVPELSPEDPKLAFKFTGTLLLATAPVVAGGMLVSKATAEILSLADLPEIAMMSDVAFGAAIVFLGSKYSRDMSVAMLGKLKDQGTSLLPQKKLPSHGLGDVFTPLGIGAATYAVVSFFHNLANGVPLIESEQKAVVILMLSYVFFEGAGIHATKLLRDNRLPVRPGEPSNKGHDDMPHND